MQNHIKKVICLATFSIIAILIFTSSVSFAVGIPNLTGTWAVKLKVKYTNVYASGNPTSQTFQDTATMKITHLPFGVIQMTIDGTSNPLIDGATPTPDFYGRGVVGSFPMGTDNHLVAIHCGSHDTYGQQIVVHKIKFRKRSTKMKGTWMIVDSRGDALSSSAEGIVAKFTAKRVSEEDPLVSTCE